MAKAAYIGVENFTPRTLPSGYTQVEYIQSSGTQYIDAGFYPKYNTRIITTVSELSATGFVYGTRSANSKTADLQFNFYRSSTTAIRSDYFGTNVSATVADTTASATIDQNGNVTQAYGQEITNTAVTSGECTYPLYLFALNNVGTASNFGSFKLYACQIYDNDVLVRDFIPCMNADGEVGLYDLVNDVFYTDAAGGTFAAGTTTYGSYARKIKKGYIGVDGVARKIRKAYIGIGGVARPFWSGGELAYYGTATALSTARSCVNAAAVGNYALIAGGGKSVVEAYSNSLTQTLATSLPNYPYNPCAGENTNYALFAGGSSGSAGLVTVSAYDSSLTQTQPTSLSQGRSEIAATTIDEYIIFGGGWIPDYQVFRTVDIYSASLTRTTSSLQSWGYGAMATSIGDYAIFVGGTGSSNGTLELATAFNKSLTKSYPTSLSKARYNGAAASIGDYALFAGGFGGRYASVETYDKSLTRSAAPDMSIGRADFAGVTLGKYAIFAGGDDGNYPLSTAIELYDASLTRSAGTDLSVGRYRLAGATVGNYALFAGGTEGMSDFATVDVYTID